MPAHERLHECRSCGEKISRQVVNFGALPISNAMLQPDALSLGEMFYPLNVQICDACSLIQLVDCPTSADAHFHEDYVYFSSYSQSWLDHCRVFADKAIDDLGLNEDDLVVEIASNDGYLLQFFKQKNIKVLGIEPSKSVADAAIAKGIETRVDFFGEKLGAGLRSDNIEPKLVIANNVIAHVPDLNDFVKGFAKLLGPESILTTEMHYFRDLFEKTQFDSFYHEHYCYYTIKAGQAMFERHGLRLFDVERLPTHGGSLRFYVCQENSKRETNPRVAELIADEEKFLEHAKTQMWDFQDRIYEICQNMRRFLIKAQREDKRVIGFGAPAKATTILNIAAITPDLLPYTIDSNPHKQGRLLPGIHIPINEPDILMQDKPDYIAILPWNLKSEIIDICKTKYNYRGKFVVFVPELEIIDA